MFPGRAREVQEEVLRPVLRQCKNDEVYGLRNVLRLREGRITEWCNGLRNVARITECIRITGCTDYGIMLTFIEYASR